MPVVDLTTHPTIDTGYGRWQPLNGPLAVGGFGISAIVCDPGEELDIEHDESVSGQQEVYIVVAGRAAFEIGEETMEAGPGEVVSAPDPVATQDLPPARARHPDRVHGRAADRGGRLWRLDRRRRFGVGHARPATPSRKASISSIVL